MFRLDGDFVEIDLRDRADQVLELAVAHLHHVASGEAVRRSAVCRLRLTPGSRRGQLQVQQRLGRRLKLL